MKKILVLMLAVALLLSAVACTPKEPEEEDPKCSSHVDANGDWVCDNEGCGASMVMTYEEYVAAPKNAAVCVETYIQNKQGWWEEDGQGKATFYTQSEDGAYFIYNMPCTIEEYNKLTKGTKIRVTGYKGIWSDEHEIIDATYTILEGSYLATPMDATALLGTDELFNHQNKYVSFKGLTVVPSTKKGSDEEFVFLYKYDGSGSEGSDLYFNASLNGKTYTFVIESYLTGKESKVYQAVKNLKIGDTIDMEGYLYWYEGPQPHIINITVN